MKLIVVTTPTFFVEEDKIITALFEEGLDVLHLRKPETPAMYSERLLTLIPDKYHRRIVTHEHFYLKEEFNESVRTICKHYDIDCIELYNIDKQSGHPSVKGMEQICDQIKRYCTK
jgi:hypothetical protein